jgi:hypothetical protein
MPRGAPKGNKYAKGRPKGVPNQTTMQFKEALNNLLEQAAPEMLKWLNRVAEEDAGKALDLTSKLAEYVYPKLGRTESKIEITQHERTLNELK